MKKKYLKPIFFFCIGTIFIFSFVFDFFHYNTVLHWENFLYLPYIWQNSGDFISETLKMFDVCSLDACIARFRPLGHLFEVLDGKAILIANQKINFGFHSVSHLLATVLTVFVIFKILNIKPNNNTSSISFFLAASTLALPQFLILNSIYFRPVKTLAALATAFIFWSWKKYKNQKPNKLETIAIFTVSCLLFLIDEQVILIFLIFLMVEVIQSFRLKTIRPLVTIGTLCVAAYIFVLSFIAPITYRLFTSSSIDLNYSKPSDFLGFNLPLMVTVLKSTLYQIGTLTGNSGEISPILTIVILFLIGILIKKDNIFLTKPDKNETIDAEKRIQSINHFLFESIIIFLGVIVMTYLLALRHPPVLEGGSPRVGYYMLPSSILLWIILLNWISVLKLSKIQCISFAIILFSISSIYSVTKIRTDIFPKPNIYRSSENISYWMESEVIGDIIAGKISYDPYYNRISDGGKFFLNSWYESVKKEK